MKKIHCLIILILLAGLAAGFFSSAAQDKNSPIYRVDVDMVLLNVAVTDGKSNYVTGLRPSDFEIYEDGILQQMATFAEGNTIPRKLSELAQSTSQPRLEPPVRLRKGGTRDPEPNLIPDPEPSRTAGAGVFVLFDTSNSMYARFAYAQEAISDLVRFLDPPDRVALYAFSRDLKRVATLTSDRQQVLRAVRSTVAGDDIALYNALLLTLKDAAKVSGRKMVVVFSNGPDNASMVSPENVRELAQAEGIPIYIISTREAQHDPVSTAAFQRISIGTGGKAYFAKSWGQQQMAFESIRQDLGHLYLLSYYPQANANIGWRKVTVKLVGNRLSKYKARTRTGYHPRFKLPAEKLASPGTLP